MDPDVIEIPPPISRPPRMRKHKEVVMHDVIEIDKEEDSVDLMFFKGVVDKSNKGKAIKVACDGYSDYQAEEAMVNFFGPTGVEALGSLNGVESSKSFDPANLINLDDHSSDISSDDNDDYIGLLSEDLMDVDEYAMLQAHFDNVDIPPGVEAPIPFLMDPPLSNNKHVTGSSSDLTTCPMQSFTNVPHGINSYSSSWSQEPAHFSMNSTSVSSPSLQIQMDNVSHPKGMDLSSPWVLSQVAQSKKKAATLQHKGAASSGVLSKSRWRRPFQCRRKQLMSSSSTSYDPVNQLDAMKLPSGVEPSFWEPYFPDKTKKHVGTSSFDSSSFPVHLDMSNHPPGLKNPPSWSQPPFKSKPPSFFNHAVQSKFNHLLDSVYHPHEMEEVPWFDNLSHPEKNDAAVGSSNNNVEATPRMDRDEILRKFQLFKQFDTVEDHSDHHYTGNGSSLKHSSKSWAKRIQEEWKILEKDLPDTIFVRVYETRMDLLRAVIVGAEGTPYHDGLFFFDVFFPSGYPNVPPHVYYHSCGLRLNPNLYNTGKVCLSLLNTWSGDKNEKWIPGTSTMLQVLVSIQGLILNPKPYFNEPGYAQMSGSVPGEKRSLQYNESTFILSLRTMMYIIRRPPKHFDDLVMGHFCSRAHDILVACQAYMDGAQVGCLVKGGVQDVDEGDKSCSKQFKDSLGGYVEKLVKEFSRIGANDCEKFLLPTVNVNKQRSSTSHDAP